MEGVAIATEALGTAIFEPLLAAAAGGAGAFGAVGAAGAFGALEAAGAGTAGAPGGRGGGLFTIPEGTGGLLPGPPAGAGFEIMTVCWATLAGGFGAEGVAEGGLELETGAAGGGTNGLAPTLGGLEIVIRVDSFLGAAGGASPDPGLAGRLIRTVSRFSGEVPAADGRGGNVIRTVSFFGSLMGFQNVG